jgi:integrase
MILVTYRHGLRASEVCGLRWDQIDLDSGRLHVRRAKGGIDNVHPLSGSEIRACVSYAGRIWKPDMCSSPNAVAPPRPLDS